MAGDMSLNTSTFDNEITPSKFIALFLAVNKSSLHPEISSCNIETGISYCSMMAEELT